MKKKLILFILICLLFVTKLVKAENACSAQALNELKTAASNLTINYEEYVGDKTYLDIKIYNLTPDMYVRGTNDNNHYNYDLYGNKLLPDGSVTVRQEVANVVVNYTFDIFVYSGPCTGEKLRTLNISVPKYNYNSQLEICDGVEDYYLCQKYTTVDFSNIDVNEQIHKYRNKLNQTTNSSTQKEKSKSSVNYKYVFLFLLIGIGIVLTIIVVKKRKDDFI